MIQFRQNVWETNSSSTHSLSMSKSNLNTPLNWRNIPEFQAEYNIYPIEAPAPSYAHYVSIPEKLSYFFTLYQMTDGSCKSLMLKLQELFPNAKFIETFALNTYVLEDGEYFTDEELLRDITLEELAIFMLCGIIRFGNRDDDNFMEEIYRIHDDPQVWGCYWCG